MGLPYGKNFIILTSTVFVGFTRVTDGQTDGQRDGRAIAYSALSIILCCRALIKHWTDITY